MASPIPSSSSNEKRSILRRSPRHQTHELNAGTTEHGSKKVGFAGFENISNEKTSNLRRSPRKQTHVPHSGTTENEAKKVGFAGLQNVSNEKRSNLRQSPRHQTHEQNSGTTENGSEEVGFVGFQNISNEKRSILRRSPRHQTRELNSGTTENGSKKVEFAGVHSINNEKRRILRQSPRNQTHELNYGTMENGSKKVNFAGFESISNEKKSFLRRSPRHQSHELDSETTENESKSINKPADHGEHVLPKLGKVDRNNDLAKSSSKSPCEQNRDSSEVKGRRYPLRTSLGTARITQSISKTENQHELVPKPLNLLRRRRRRRRKKGDKVKKASKDEFFVIMKRVRYLLTRMNYEQNLIDAYSGEGWKGQSADKLRPEKELERAKSEIVRRKFKIRELFRHLDSLSSEGRIEASLFDSEGQLNSEDIFCATCGSKDLSPDNDIILCDGLCDRGFHQKCLNPPLLSEDIPPGDEGWLCPACCCKIDCIKLLNELQGSNLSIKDTWEKVFPEVVAMTNEDKKRDDLPSNDSEDYDYGSDGSEVDFERSGSTSSEDDSDDDDFDPNDSNVDKSVPKYGSSSDESNFKSDSAKFCIELRKTLRAKKDSAPSVRNLKPIANSGEGTCTVDICNSEIPSVLEPGLDQENLLTSGKRNLENFELKHLSDETYETSPSDSSEDENWSESADINMPNRRKKYANRKEPYGPSNANTRTVSHVHETTPSKTYPALDASAMEHVEHHGCSEPGSIEFSVSTSKSFSEAARKKLCEIFQKNQYPTRAEKESLAKELGLTYQQVQRWFINSRHSFCAPTKEASPNEVPSASNDIAATNENTKCINEVGKDGQEAVARQLLGLHESFQENQYLTWQNKESLSQVLGLTYQQEHGWFMGSHSICLSTNEAPLNGLPSPNKDNSATNENIRGINLNYSGGSISPMYATEGIKRKNPISDEQLNVGDEQCSMSKVDKEREKAVARELRKMKKRR
ncbi:uncharacterized protein A4U43_C07F29910 [Asparagus officinalis]|uniref:Uncharacterized protein n=1 Tax=Asparagus officinalis TaxID=4686 RepID=A0A5P1EFV9_ASPOF|nr:uncharacterized protein A4U43_C07F29910 [Asparagus officinalis]